MDGQKPTVPGPPAVSRHERIFTDSAWIRARGCPPVHCALGVSFPTLTLPLTSNPAQIAAALSAFSEDKYVLWPASASGAPLRISVGLKEGHTPCDHLRAWAHAHEVVRMCGGRTPEGGFEGHLKAVREARACVRKCFPGFVDAARAARWKVDEGALVGGSPASMAVEVVEAGGEDRKNV